MQDHLEDSRTESDLREKVFIVDGSVWLWHASVSLTTDTCSRSPVTEIFCFLELIDLRREEGGPAGRAEDGGGWPTAPALLAPPSQRPTRYRPSPDWLITARAVTSWGPVALMGRSKGAEQQWQEGIEGASHVCPGNLMSAQGFSSLPPSSLLLYWILCLLVLVWLCLHLPSAKFICVAAGDKQLINKSPYRTLQLKALHHTKAWAYR